VKLHPRKKMLCAKGFNFLFHKMECIDVCAINQSLDRPNFTSFCFFISIETRGLIWNFLPSILVGSLPSFHVLLLLLLLLLLQSFFISSMQTLIPPHLWTNEMVGSGENKKTANPFLLGTTHAPRLLNWNQVFSFFKFVR
jgi:hypothetical protein